MAKRGSSKDLSSVLLNMKIAQPKTQENVKTKIDTLRAIFPNRSKNDFVLVLQHFDYNLDNAVHAFLEGNVLEILGAWNMPKKKAPKKKKTKAQDVAAQNPEQGEGKVQSCASAVEPGACASEATSETCSGVSEHGRVPDAGCDGVLKDGFVQDPSLSSERNCRSGTGDGSRCSSISSEISEVSSGFLENGSDHQQQQLASQPFDTEPLSPGAKKIHFQDQNLTGQVENAFDFNDSSVIVSTHSVMCSSTSSDSLPGSSAQCGTLNRQTELGFTHHDDRATSYASSDTNLSAIMGHSSSKVPADKSINIASAPPVTNVGSQGQRKRNLSHKEQVDNLVGVSDRGKFTSLSADTSGGVLKSIVNLDKNSAADPSAPSACKEQASSSGTTVTWQDQSKRRDSNSNDDLERGIGVVSERKGNSPAVPSASAVVVDSKHRVAGTVHVFGPADIYSRREKMLLKRSVSLGTQCQQNSNAVVGNKVQLDRRRSNPAKVEGNSQVIDVNCGLEKKPTAMSLGDIGFNSTEKLIQHKTDPDSAIQLDARAAPEQSKMDSQTARRDSQTGRRDSQTVSQDSHCVNGDIQTPRRDSHADTKNIQPTRRESQSTESDTSSVRRDSQSAMQESQSDRQDSLTDRRDSQSSRRDSQPNRRDSQSSRRDSQPSRRNSQSADQDSQGNRSDSQSGRRDSQPTRRDSQSFRRDSSTAKQDSQPDRRDSSTGKQDSQPDRRDSSTAKQDSQPDRRDSSTAKQDSQPDNVDSDVSRRDSQSERRDSQSDRRNSATQRKDSNADRRDSNSGRKGSLPGRKNSAGRRDSGSNSRRDSNPDQKDGKGGRRDSGGASRKENRRRPGGNIERSVKDLQRCVVSLNRYQTLLKEEVDVSTKKIKAAFSEITDWLMDREVNVFTELDSVKHEAMGILNARQRKATELKRLCDKNNAAQMSEAQLAALRAEIKQFVSERKYDEDLGKTAHFTWDREATKKMIDIFGALTHPKSGHTVPVSVPVDTLHEASTAYQSSSTGPSKSHASSAQTDVPVATTTRSSLHPALQPSPPSAIQHSPATPVQLSSVSIVQGNPAPSSQETSVANSQLKLGPIRNNPADISEQSSKVATTQDRPAPVNQSSVTYTQQSNVGNTQHSSVATAQSKSTLVQGSPTATPQHKPTAALPHSTTDAAQHGMTAATKSPIAHNQHSSKVNTPHSTPATVQQSPVTNQHNTEAANQERSITITGDESKRVSATHKSDVTPAHSRSMTMALVENSAPQMSDVAPVENKVPRLLEVVSGSRLTVTSEKSSTPIGSSLTTAEVSPVAVGQNGSVTVAQVSSQPISSAQNGPLAGDHNCSENGSRSLNESQAAAAISFSPAKVSLTAVGVARLTQRTGPILGYRFGTATREGTMSRLHNGMPVVAKQFPVSKPVPLIVPITTPMASPHCVSQSTTPVTSPPSGSNEANSKPRRTGPIKPKRPSSNGTATVPSVQPSQISDTDASVEKAVLPPVTALPQRESRRLRETLPELHAQGPT